MILANLFERRDSLENPSVALYQALTGMDEPSTSGISLSDEQAANVPDAFACIQVISQDIARCPLRLRKQLDDGGHEDAIGHPLWELLHDLANPETTAYQFKEDMQRNLLTYEKAYAEIVRSPRGEIVSLWALDPRNMTVSRDGMNRKIYSYRVGLGQPIKWAFDPSRPPILELSHRSPLKKCRDLIAMAYAMELYGAKFFANGARVSGVLEVPAGVSLHSEARINMRESFTKFFGGVKNAHKVALLEGGTTFKQVSAQNDEAQFNQTRKLVRAQIAGIFRVPPHKIGDLERATFSNIEEQGIDYVNSLSPFLRQWAQAIRRDLLTTRQYPRYEVAFDTDELTQASITVKYAAMAVLRQNGLASANDILRKLNENPIGTADGGDVYLINGNMVPVSQAVAPKPEPVKPEPDDSGDEELNARLDAIEVAVRTKPVEVHNHITTPDVRNEITVQPSQAPEVKNEFLVEAPVVHNHVAPAEVSVPVTVEAPAPTRTIVEKHVVRDSEGRMSHVREVHVQEDQT